MKLLSDLDRRISRKVDTRRGIRLTPEDLDLLVLSGALEALRGAVTVEQKSRCLERKDAERPPVRVGRVTASDRGNKLADTAPAADAGIALMRARQITQRGGR
jgi:hypothetical protein